MKMYLTKCEQAIVRSAEKKEIKKGGARCLASCKMNGHACKRQEGTARKGLTWFQVDRSREDLGTVHIIDDMPMLHYLVQLLGFEVENVRIMRVWT